VDASSFQKCDNGDSDFAKNPIAYVGAELERHGYARHGQEVMINGFTGEEMPCDIFIGLVYYQRLRHMVKDKFQVCCHHLSA
jgi:DNA-directed RNA polymerase I subunit RPA2